jgi:AraC-like DNA-binding protein/ligand-binding sensor protein
VASRHKLVYYLSLMAAPTKWELALLNDFQVLVYRLFGVHSTIYLRGLSIEHNPWEASRPWFCHKLRKQEELLQRCQQSDCELMRSAVRRSVGARCHAGLGQLAVPIHRRGRLEGHLICSPVRLESEKPAGLADRMSSKLAEFGLNQRYMTSFAQEVPVLTRQARRELVELTQSFFRRFFQKKSGASQFNIYPEPVRTGSDENAWISFLWAHWWNNQAEGYSARISQRGHASLLYSPRQRCAIVFDHRRVVLKAGQMVLLPEGSVYRVAAEARQLFFEIYFYSSADLDYLSYRVLYPRGRVYSILVEIGRRVQADAGFSFNSEGKMKVLELLLELKRATARPLPERGRPVGSGSSESLARALAFLGANLSRKLALRQVAQVSGMSVANLERRFRADVGMSPLTYQRSLRLIEAKQLLLATDTPIKSIAYELGFANPRHFADVFRKTTGVSPVQYRQAEKSEKI